MKLDTQENESHGLLKVIFSKMGWAYREQPIQDVGIDAHVELAGETGETSGKLLALQVKAGPSYFKEETEDSFVFRTDENHAAYWKSHSLPVILVLVNLEERMAYFAPLNAQTLNSTGKGYKVEVLKANTLDGSAGETLEELAEGPEEVQRYRVLALATDLMNLIEKGGDVFLEAEEWINKSSGRGSITLVVDDGSGGKVDRDWGFIAPGWNYADLFQQMVPWADFEVDDELYYDEEEWRYKADNGIYDSEDGKWYFDSSDFRKWRANLPTIRAYAVEVGEVAKYRLKLSLNELGSGFLTVDRFVREGEHWSARKKLWTEK